nr:hypothetical protein [Tanacetum cinerariifolium]
MTTPHPTPFPATTPRAGVLVPFVIISNSDDEITTLPIRPAPPSSNCRPALSGYPLDSGDDSSDDDLSETKGDLDGTRLQSSHGSMKSCTTIHLSSTTSIRDTIIIFTTTTALTIIIFTIAITFTILVFLASAMQETMTLRVRVRLLEQHDVFIQDSLRIERGGITWSQLRTEYAEQEVRELREFWVTNKLEILELHCRAEYAESCLEQRHDRKTRDGARTQRTDMTGQDIEASHARAKSAEQQAETLQVPLGAARIDFKDLIESHEADMFEMDELQSRVQDIDASF